VFLSYWTKRWLSFRAVKAFGLKQAPKLTIALLDRDDLRALAHLMNSYPSVLKEKAILVQASLPK
jgi:polyadenylate-binding protein